MLQEISNAARNIRKKLKVIILESEQSLSEQIKVLFYEDEDYVL